METMQIALLSDTAATPPGQPAGGRGSNTSGVKKLELALKNVGQYSGAIDGDLGAPEMTGLFNIAYQMSSAGYAGFATIGAGLLWELISGGNRTALMNKVEQYSDEIAGAINAYALLKGIGGKGGSGGSGAAHYPPGSEQAVSKSGRWRIAIPKGTAVTFSGGGLGSTALCRGCINTPDIANFYGADVGDGPLGAPTHDEVPNPTGAKADTPAVVPEKKLKGDVGDVWYRKWWFWTGVGVAVAGGGTYWYMKRKKGRR